MIEAPGGFRFAEKARSRFNEFGVAEFCGKRNGLDRDHAIDRGVSSQVNDAHGTAADFAFELVASEPLGLGHRRGNRGRSGAIPRGRAQVRRRRAQGCRRHRRWGRGLGLDAVRVHETAQSRRHVLIRVVESGQMPVDRSGLGDAAALFHLVAQRIKILQDRRIGLSALEFGKPLFEVIQQSCGIGTHGGPGSGHRNGWGALAHAGPDKQGAAARQ